MIVNPKILRKKIGDHLISQDKYMADVIEKLAKLDLEKQGRLSGAKKEPTEWEIKGYISNNIKSLNDRAEQAIRETCKDLIPESFICWFIKQFWLLSVCIGAPILALLHFAVCWFKQEVQIDNQVSFELFGALILLILFYGAGILASLLKK